MEASQPVERTPDEVNSSIIQNMRESSTIILTKAKSVKGNFTGFHFMTAKD